MSHQTTTPCHCTLCKSEGPGPRYTSYIPTYTYRRHAGPQTTPLTPANHASIPTIIASPLARLAHDASLLLPELCVPRRRLVTHTPFRPSRTPCLVLSGAGACPVVDDVTQASSPLSLFPLPPSLPPASKAYGGPSEEKGAKSSQHYGQFLLESHPRRQFSLYCLPCLPHQEQHQILGRDATVELQAKIRLSLPHLLLLRPRLSWTRLGGG